MTKEELEIMLDDFKMKILAMYEIEEVQNDEQTN